VEQAFLPLILGILGGFAAVGMGLYLAERRNRRAREAAGELLAEAERDGESRQREIMVSAQEKALAYEEQSDRREHELEEQESTLEQRAHELDRLASEQKRIRKQLDRRQQKLGEREAEVVRTEETASSQAQAARENLERVAGLTEAEARSELIGAIEEGARR